MLCLVSVEPEIKKEDKFFFCGQTQCIHSIIKESSSKRGGYRKQGKGRLCHKVSLTIKGLRDKVKRNLIKT